MRMLRRMYLSASSMREGRSPVKSCWSRSVGPESVVKTAHRSLRVGLRAKNREAALRKDEPERRPRLLRTASGVDQVNPALRTNARSRATLGWNRESVMGSESQPSLYRFFRRTIASSSLAESCRSSSATRM